ncbi:MAG: hypothetical protein AAF514_23415, partial [Verrucomicrobiota bacterium]
MPVKEPHGEGDEVLVGRDSKVSKSAFGHLGEPGRFQINTDNDENDGDEKDKSDLIDVLLPGGAGASLREKRAVNEV